MICRICVASALIARLQADDEMRTGAELFAKGQPIQVTSGPFAGIQGVYLMADGEQRAIVLIELLRKPAKLPVLLGEIKSVSN